MADEAQVNLFSKNLPPKQIEGYLTVKKKVSCSIPSRKYYAVLFGDVLQLFDHERSYVQKQQNPKEQIDLQKVYSISETVQVIKGQKTNGDFCFKLELPDQHEVVFSAKSKDEVKDWVRCLKHTKAFYENSLQKENVRNPLISVESKHLNIDQIENKNDTEPRFVDPSHISLSIIMSHGPKYTAYMAPDSNLDDIWTAVLKWLPGHYCEKCHNCQLRRSTMELWTVDEEAIAFKVDENYSDFNKRDIYLLEHNFKLLVVFFEDSTFLVSPVDISIKSREVPEIESFARKLSSIDCNNAQLYLVTSSQSVTPFSPDEQPLAGYFWEQRGSEWTCRDRKGDKLLLKSRALITPLDSRTTAEKCQELKTKKILEERKQKIVIKEIEKSQVQKRAIRTTIAPDTVSTLNDWSKTSMIQRNSKIIKPCVINVPKKLHSQNTVPFDYNSDEDILDASTSKAETVSQKDETTNEGISKRRSTSESHAPIRKGAVRYKDGRRRTIPEICPTKNCYSALSDAVDSQSTEQNECENAKLKEKNEKISDDDHCHDSDKEETFITVDRPGFLASENNEGEKGQGGINIDVDGERLEHGLSSLRNDGSSKDTLSLSSSQSLTTSSSPSPSINTGNVSTDQSGTSEYSLQILSTEDVPSEHQQGHSFSKFYISPHSNGGYDDDDKITTVKKEIPSYLAQEKDKSSCSTKISNLSSNNGEGGSFFSISEITQEQNQDTCIDVSESNIYIKTAPRHSCDYYVVASPQVLKPILDQYERIKKGEVEVNCVCPPQKLCLSTTHLVYSNYQWVVGIQEDLSNDCEEDLNCEEFTLQPDIKVVFYPSKRMWSVRHIGSNDNIVHSGNGESSDLTDKDNEPSNIDVLLLSTKREFPQLTMLDNSIQKIFYQGAQAEGLDDTKYPDLRRVICVDFCSALHSLLNHGLKRRRTLFGTARYSLWEVVQTCTVSPEHTTLLQKIKQLGQLEDKTCLELFVCECLNTGSDALAVWLESFKKQDLTLFYDDYALIRKLDGDVLVQKLSRLTFLPFRLTYFKELQNQLKQSIQTAFIFE